METNEIEALRRTNAELVLALQQIKALAGHYRDCLQTIVRNDERNNHRDGNTISAINALKLAWTDCSPAAANAGGQDCGMSWDGKNVRGDKASIMAVKTALHEAGTVPELKDMIRTMQDRTTAASAAALDAERFVWWFNATN